LAVRPSLYKSEVVFSDLESCFPQNKRLRDKIGLDPNLPELIRSNGLTTHPWRSVRQLLIVPDQLKSVVNNTLIKVRPESVWMTRPIMINMATLDSTETRK
jgi:hypothetical protein